MDFIATLRQPTRKRFDNLIENSQVKSLVYIIQFIFSFEYQKYSYSIGGDTYGILKFQTTLFIGIGKDFLRSCVFLSWGSCAGCTKSLRLGISLSPKVLKFS